MKWWQVPSDTPLSRAIAAADRDDVIDDEGTREHGRINMFSGHWRDLELRVVDSDAVSWFRHGNCAGLALAMHETSGWPLVLITGITHSRDPKQNWVHALVAAPDGRLVDIEGAHSPGAVVTAWSKDKQTARIEQVDLNTFVDRVGGTLETFSTLEAEVIRDFARHVLADLPVTV